ncbi:MAG: efflux RND transporter periplasmic adaptor subunit [Alphaproteobacteria bacterium]|nr:efflux RND transporter periplasmic adaptor subunit [Alphaproteobacteria bacterium]
MTKKKIIITVGVLVLLAFGGWKMFSRGGEKHLKEPDFEMVKVEKGNVVYSVTASGKIQPINTVSVGTQVSGIIEEVLADYNDEVKKDQVLARLDTSVLRENLNDAQAQLDLANAKEKIEQLNYKRTKQLYEEKLIAKTTFEEAEIALETAKASVLSAQANFNRANQNYGYATITSPVSGTVISKEVEQGQTVAASFSTPTMFKIAEDLTKMQIEANIAEADIGMITTHMPVTFTVDAYPNDTFDGTVEQIRLSPTEEQNVVMYTVVIQVDNSSRKLLPGMTASVDIKIQEALDVLTLPAMALQYKPSNAVKNQMKMEKISDLSSNQAVVYHFKNKKMEPVIIEKGLADLSLIEIKSGLKEGDSVILEAKTKGPRR